MKLSSLVGGGTFLLPCSTLTRNRGLQNPAPTPRLTSARIARDPGRWGRFFPLLLLLSLTLGACSPESGGPGETAPSPPDVTTGTASALGTTAMTVDGSIHPHGRYTTWYFEYGLSTDYGSRTEETPLPPQLGAVYHESWDQGLGGWASWLTAESFETGGAEEGFVRFSEPSRHDRNHDDGIGTLHLTKYLWTGSLGAGEDTARAWLGGGDPDLRGARVSLWARGNDWRPNGSEVLWWTQSQSNIELGHQPGWRRANWAYTGYTLTDQLLDGRWNLFDYRLLNDSSQWTYGGNNPTLQGESAARYAYWSIDQAQAHVNCDFFHLAATVDIDNPPTGSLDFDDFRLVYRNHSLVYPSNGGRLIRWPEGADEAPARLTDGWRHGPGRTWRSGSRPDQPQEFVFALDREVTVKTIQVHQNPEWPGKQVEVLASEDDRQYAMVATLTLPEEAKNGPNFAFALETGLAAKARYLKFRLLSGYREEHWGLGEIEIFGTGARMLPDDDLYYVNTDLEGLTPGATVHYRLVASGADGTVYGEDRTFTVPGSPKPRARTGKVLRMGAREVKVQGRLNAMGLRSRYYFEYGNNPGYGSRTPEQYAGQQISPRTVFHEFRGLKPETGYHYRLVVSNDEGVSYGGDRSFHTAGGPQ